MAELRTRREEEFMAACVAMIGRTGAKDFQLRYSDDEPPVVWIAVAAWVLPSGHERAECAAALHPVTAAFRLCESAIDGGQCAHCKRPTGITEVFDEMPMPENVCWYQYDPETKAFRRGCEG